MDQDSQWPRYLLCSVWVSAPGLTWIIRWHKGPLLTCLLQVQYKGNTPLKGSESLNLLMIDSLTHIITSYPVTVTHTLNFKLIICFDSWRPFKFIPKEKGRKQRWISSDMKQDKANQFGIRYVVFHLLHWSFLPMHNLEIVTLGPNRYPEELQRDEKVLTVSWKREIHFHVYTLLYLKFCTMYPDIWKITYPKGNKILILK